MNRKCPFCLWPLSATESVVACSFCGAHYHADCYEENGLSCATFGCVGWATPSEPVLVSREHQTEGSVDDPTAENPAVRRISLDPQDLDEATVPRAVEPETGAVAFCSQCGNRIGAEDQFCYSCGNALGATA